MSNEEVKTRRPEDPETQSNGVETLRPEDPETQSHGVKTRRPEDPETQSHEVTESQNPGVVKVDGEEIYNKLKSELMDEIRKYFEPLVKKGENATVQTVDPLGDEENLITKLLEETGWRNG